MRNESSCRTPSQIQRSICDNHPTSISNDGVIEQSWITKLTGSAPKQNITQFYDKEVDTSKPVFS